MTEQMIEPRLCTKCGEKFDKVQNTWTANLCKACQAQYEAERRAQAPYKLRFCRVCGASSEVKKFSPRRLICISCDHQVHKERDKRIRKDYATSHKGDPVYLASKRLKQDNYLQSSPDAFMCNCWHHIKLANRVKGTPIGIDITYLRELYKTQNGRCALTGLGMTHKFHDLKSISVDRIQSNLGYISGNVQLVCRWVNLAKNTHSNEEFKQILQELRIESVIQENTNNKN